MSRPCKLRQQNDKKVLGGETWATKQLNASSSIIQVPNTSIYFLFYFFTSTSLSNLYFFDFSTSLFSYLSFHLFRFPSLSLSLSLCVVFLIRNKEVSAWNVSIFWAIFTTFFSLGRFSASIRLVFKAYLYRFVRAFPLY